MAIERRHAYLLGGIPLAFLLLVVAAWGIDTATSEGQVARNVEVEGQSVSGLEQEDLLTVAADLNAALLDVRVQVDLDSEQVELDAHELGVRVDGEAFVDEALDARRDGFILARPFRWVGSFFSTQELTVPYTVDEEAVSDAAQEITESVLDEPQEPDLAVEGDVLVVVEGSEGRMLEATTLSTALLPMMEAGAPHTLELATMAVPPEVDADTVSAIAAEANAATGRGAIVEVRSDEASITAAELRNWVVLDTDAAEPTWVLDEATVQGALQPLFPTLGDPDKQAHFQISAEGRPVIVPAAESIVCCAEGSSDVMKDALLTAVVAEDDTTGPEGDGPGDGAESANGDTGSQNPDSGAASEAGPPVRVPLEVRITDEDTGVEELEALGIVEQVSTFTTNHNCCENRVTNIHIMADIVRGAVIRPGETFSLNGYVGKRTLERGFLPAGAIAQGNFEDQVGGGVSQFATTIFNAAFFAGLDFEEYQSHSIYISRYPRGREATVSWPKPDLKFTNNTPYGILIWPTYTDTSITVSFYSTEHVTVEALGTRDSPQRACTRVTTSRKRTWEDGREEIDSVFAVYRPGEGLNCAGESTVPTTAPPATTTPETTDPGAETTAPTETTTPAETTAPPATTAPPETTAPPATTATTAEGG